TPLWMQEKLRRCGIRCLHPVVDITNFVMLELGQPMHGFDLAKLDGGLVVRQANADETLVLLDGKEIKMDAATLVIADHSGALALAGVMGGEGSAVEDSTTSLFLESAYFTPEKIAGKARAYGLHTDSSHRFERGVDFQRQVIAMQRASALVLEICGGEAGPVQNIRHPEYLPILPEIDLRRARIAQLLGITLSDDRVEEILSGLGCELSSTATGWTVVPPSYRFDLRIEVDLIEELARIYGYDNIPSNSRHWSPRIEVLPEAQVPVSKLKGYLSDLGYQEVITYSFIDAATEVAINPMLKAKPLANPISSDLGVMRTTLWGGLLKAIQHNQRRQQKRVRVFESGLVFQQQGDELKQVAMLGAAMTGRLFPEQWNQQQRDVDFYDIKGDLEMLFQTMAIPGNISWKPSGHPALHPGQSAEVLLDGNLVGQVGALHPEVQKTLDLDQPTFLFELTLDALLTARIPRYQPMSKFPSVRRDLAIVVDENVSYARILEVIKSSGLELIRECQIFDLYKGKTLASGRKSLALGLILQDLSRTLSEQEVEQTIALVLKKLEVETGASLRE
ncbi:MAG TPA: phenylalanine--tRNA ligase subunit beta, partial [Gammaproteobacteria bacterium]|nr:phenylalanine--tRNA ligase subunit beta [Gammaproteobacteria bacterium]